MAFTQLDLNYATEYSKAMANATRIGHIFPICTEALTAHI